jgi:hypothetical protein
LDGFPSLEHPMSLPACVAPSMALDIGAQEGEW